MQTAILIPEPLFKQADQVAGRLGITRNEFYLQAVAAFVAACNRNSITEQLNEVYTSEDSSVDPILWQLQIMSIPQDTW